MLKVMLQRRLSTLLMRPKSQPRTIAVEMGMVVTP
jgi:hypothetical protein